MVHISAMSKLFFCDGSWEIGYHVGCIHTGKGYASEAVKAFLPIIMKRLGITEMRGICALDNLASMRVMKKKRVYSLFPTIGSESELPPP